MPKGVKNQETSGISPNCLQCGIFMNGGRSNRRFCSDICNRKWSKTHRIPNISCLHCHRQFFTWPSKLSKEKPIQFCSRMCAQGFRSSPIRSQAIQNLDYENPREWELNEQGYIKPEMGLRGLYYAQHQVVVSDWLGLMDLPSEYHIHHRDLDKTNNRHDNLAIMTRTDHRWLHEQAGSIGLKLFSQGKLDAQTMANTTSDPERFEKLITLSIFKQNASDFI